MDDLESSLAQKRDQLRTEEEFARKPFQERLIIQFMRGAESYEGVRRLDGEDLVEEILDKWNDAKIDEDVPEVTRILDMLPEALKQRYTVTPIPKAARYKVSRPLVAALTDKHLMIRATAIACLQVIYGTALGYDPEMPPSKRLEIKKDWQKQIDKLRR